MKKIFFLLSVCCLVIVLGACSSETRETVESDGSEHSALSSENAESSSSSEEISEEEKDLSSETEDSSVADSSRNSKPEENRTVKKAEGDAATSSNPNLPQAATSKQEPQPVKPQSQPQTSSSARPESTSKPETTGSVQSTPVPPSVPEQVPPSSSESDPESETGSETVSEPAAPSFHISEYVEYAKDYILNELHLTLDPSTTSCSDDPIDANANSLYIKRDLKDRLDWYQISGFTTFWVWSEDLGGGNYNIYIGYA